MSRTIRSFIDSDRLSVELDAVLGLDAPITPALIGADGTSVEAMRADALRSAVRSAMRAYPSARRSLEDAIAQGKPEGKVAQRKAERDAAWSKLIAALVAAGVERR